MGCISNAPNYAQNIPSVYKWCTKPTIHCAVSRGRGILSTIIGATVKAFGKETASTPLPLITRGRPDGHLDYFNPSWSEGQTSRGEPEGYNFPNY
jgi:hypothetical protein